MVALEIKPSGTMRTRVLVVVVVGVLIVGYLSTLLIGGTGAFFNKKIPVRTFMADVSGLEKGANVRISGRPIGSVAGVKISTYLDPQRAVQVDMEIEQRYLAMIPADSITNVGADTLIGARFIDINLGKSPLPLAPGGILKAEPPELDADKADLVVGMQDTLKRVDELIVSFADPKSRIGQVIYGQEEYDKILQRITSVDSAIRTMVSPDSGIGKAMLTMDLYNQAHEPVVRIGTQLEAMQKGEGPAGQLLTNPEQYNNILKQLQALHRQLADANAGKGQLGALTHDEETYARLQSTLSALDRTISSLNAGEGRLGQLMNNPETYESLAGQMRDLRAMLIDIRLHPQKYLRIKIF